jgi:hypothetical protein
MELKQMGEEGFDLRHCEKWMRSSAVQLNLEGSNDSTSWRLNTRRYRSSDLERVVETTSSKAPLIRFVSSG